ncbi:pentapeptide repeat-containing protein [Actinomycetospora sp. TBRC 11914]|uniref:pentapeptide repeat-containing protein n=1 Tax=Actinomycetospora sp. TBRC 11914 TaxID=2729387 RepID=UPI00145F1D7D|nr:pentapeptide repeat-containing protein [Actinomycetospora sp. TBRC 11914]NMO91994.1 pentapeptide repeat-containing protein [Actinomycetospora sp. TBRC 11914]
MTATQPGAEEVAALLAAGEPVEDADLSGLDLRVLLDGRRDPVLRRCTADEPDLHGADLTGLTLEGCHFPGADLRGTTLDRARVRGGSLAGAIVVDADLTDAVFEATDLSRLRLTGSLLTETRFTDCRMIGADLSGVRGLAVTYRLDGSNLGLANLQDVVWRGVVLRGLDLSEADLRGADLRDATLVGCTLRDVDLAHTRLTGADLRGADLGELTEDAPRTLRGAVVSESQAADVCRALGLVVGPGG